MRFWIDHPLMVIDMNESKLKTLEQIREFLTGSTDVVFLFQLMNPRYAHLSPACSGALVTSRDARVNAACYLHTFDA